MRYAGHAIILSENKNDSEELLVRVKMENEENLD